jgi:hypothetical protein
MASHLSRSLARGGQVASQRSRSVSHTLHSSTSLLSNVIPAIPAAASIPIESVHARSFSSKTVGKPKKLPLVARRNMCKPKKHLKNRKESLSSHGDDYRMYGSGGNASGSKNSPMAMKRNPNNSMSGSSNLNGNHSSSSIAEIESSPSMASSFSQTLPGTKQKYRKRGKEGGVLAGTGDGEMDGHRDPNLPQIDYTDLVAHKSPTELKGMAVNAAKTGLADPGFWTAVAERWGGILICWCDSTDSMITKLRVVDFNCPRSLIHQQSR